MEHNGKYNSADEWLKNNRHKLEKYSGEWIAFTNEGVIFHDKSGSIVIDKARENKKIYYLKYVHPSEIYRPYRIIPFEK